MLRIDSRSWWAGFFVAAGHLSNRVPSGMDSYSFRSGYLEGKV